MRILLAGTASLLLVACDTTRTPLATAHLKGDYRGVAVCTRSQLTATERNMIYADDAEHRRAVLWEDARDGDVGGRKFDLAFQQGGDGEVAVEVRQLGGTRADQDQFLARLDQVLKGCRAVAGG
jgi:hypothetical protein